MEDLTGDLAPERLAGHQVAEVSRLLRRIERRAAGCRLLLADAVARTGLWRQEGFRSPQEWAARRNGTTVGDAKSDLQAAKRLAGLPAARDAVAAGAVSAEAAKAVAEGATADPGAEADLVAKARSGDLSEVRDAARRARQRADERCGRAAQRMYQRRALRTWIELDGEGRGTWNVPPAYQAAFLAALEPYRHAAHHAARQAGRRPTPEALMADAMYLLAQDVLTDHHPTNPTAESSEHANEADAPGPPESANDTDATEAPEPTVDAAPAPSEPTVDPHAAAPPDPTGRVNGADAAAPSESTSPAQAPTPSEPTSGAGPSEPTDHTGTTEPPEPVVDDTGPAGHRPVPTGPPGPTSDTDPTTAPDPTDSHDDPTGRTDATTPPPGQTGSPDHPASPPTLFPTDDHPDDRNRPPTGRPDPPSDPTPNGERPTDRSAPGAPSPPVDRSRLAERPPRGGTRRPPAQIHIHIDHDALVRGYARDGERCEIPGLGPIPVALARDLANDAILHLILTGTDVTVISTHRRYIPAPLERALRARDPECVVPGCHARHHLQMHHWPTDFAAGCPTSLATLARICTYHHHLITHCAWRLTGGPHNWKLLPPNTPDPDQPP